MKPLSDRHGSYLAGRLLKAPYAAILRLSGPQAKRADGRKAPLWG